MKKMLKNAETKILPVSVIFVLFALAFTTVFFSLDQYSTVKADSTDFSYHKLITIESDYVVTNLINFPVMVYNISNDFKDTNNGGYIQPDGDDIAFFSYDNNTQYNHEIEEYDGETGTLLAWVNVTSISSSSDTNFWVFYGDADGTNQQNKSGVWDNYYAAVWHMNGTVPDSGHGLYESKNGYWLDNLTTAEVALGIPSEDTGIAGNAQLFTGDVIQNNTFLDSGQTLDWTWEVFVKPTQDTPATDAIIGYKKYTASDRTYFYQAANGSVKGYIRDGGTLIYAYGEIAAVKADSWHYLAIVYNANDHFYVIQNTTRYTGGTAQNGQAGGTTSNFCLGGYGDEDQGLLYTFNGTLDEVRISNVERNASWTNATYYSIMFPSLFLTFGSESGEEPISVDLSGLDDDTNITWSGQATQTVWSNATYPGGTLNITINLTAAFNCTEICVFCDDLDTNINASNISIQFSSDNTTWGSNIRSFLNGGSNISIDDTNWTTDNGCYGSDPFSGAGITDGEFYIYARFKLTIPITATSGTYSQGDWKVWVKVVS